MTKSSISRVFDPYSLQNLICLDNGAQLVQRRKLPVIAAEVTVANAQSTNRLVLNADGACVDWGRGQFYTAKLAHLRFRRIFLAVFQIGACGLYGISIPLLLEFIQTCTSSAYNQPIAAFCHN